MKRIIPECEDAIAELRQYLDAFPVDKYSVSPMNKPEQNDFACALARIERGVDMLERAVVHLKKSKTDGS